MILEIYKDGWLGNPKDLQKLDNLVSSDTFLKTLGGPYGANLAATGFPIVNDIFLADDMMTSQEMWDLLEPWPYQYFVGVIEDESGRLMYKTGVSKEKALAISDFIRVTSDAYAEQILRLLEQLYNKNNTLDLADRFQDKSRAEYILTDSFKNSIIGYLHYMIKGALFAGLDNSPVFQRMYEAFLTGGIPCGWVGPLPEDGGDPVECMQLFHLG